MSARLSKLSRRTAARLGALASSGEPAPAIRILTYHRVNDTHPNDRLSVRTDAFAAQMEYLTRNHPVLSLSEAFSSLQSRGGRAEAGVAVTFDDGYLDNFERALPILERFSVRAAFFIVTGIAGTRQVIERYRDCCEKDASMDWGQVKELLNRGHEVGGHGRTHCELAGLEGEELDREITGCRGDLEVATGRSPSFFCYPRGSENPRVRSRVAASGFEAALTIYPGANVAGCDPYALRRTEISGDDEIQDFRMKLRGGYDNLHRWIQAVRR